MLKKKKIFNFDSFLIFLSYIFIVFFMVSCGASSKNQASGLSQMDENLSQGQKQYHLRGCAKCHGILGRGDGLRNSLTGVMPRDFQDHDSFIQGYDLKSISETIKNGITSKENSVMPKYPFLTKEERDQIALYVLYLSTNQ